MTEQKRRRKPNPPWERIYGKDRKYTARVGRAMARGEYTPPKQKPA